MSSRIVASSRRWRSRGSRCQVGRQPSGGGEPALADVGQHRHRCVLVGRAAGDRERGVLRGHPGWRPHLHHDLVVRRTPLRGHPGDRVDRPPGRHHHLDRTVGSVVPGQADRPQRRGARERCARVRQHRGPGPLLPGQRAGVVDVDAGVDRRPLPTAHPAPDVVVALTAGEHLAAADHAVLGGEQVVAISMRLPFPGGGAPHTAAVEPVDEREPGESARVLSHQVTENPRRLAATGRRRAAGVVVSWLVAGAPRTSTTADPS